MSLRGKTCFLPLVLLLLVVPAHAGVRCKFVRIHINGNGKTLSLAEVQVFSRGKNVAKGCATFQSSVASGGSPGRAVDGNTDGTYNNQSVTHTREENEPWWEVELPRPLTVDKVVVWNRTESNQNRLNGMRIRLLDRNRKVVWGAKRDKHQKTTTFMTPSRGKGNSGDQRT
jgi:hypothetical protein